MPISAAVADVTVPSLWRPVSPPSFLLFRFFLLPSRSLSLSLESEEEEEEVEASPLESALSLSLLLLELELLLPLPPALCFLAPWSNARSHHASPQSVAGAVALLAPT